MKQKAAKAWRIAKVALFLVGLAAVAYGAYLGYHRVLNINTVTVTNDGTTAAPDELAEIKSREDFRRRQEMAAREIYLREQIEAEESRLADLNGQLDALHAEQASFQ